MHKFFIILILGIACFAQGYAQDRSELPAKRISLNFQNIPIRSVLQLLAELTEINIVVSPEVQGSITLRLNDIPWNKALEFILATNDLEKRQIGDILFIAPTIEFLQKAKSELKAKENMRDWMPLQSKFLQINYAKASEMAALIKDKTNSLLSQRGQLSVDDRTNTLWVEDTALQIKKIKTLIQHLDVPVQQVLIEARIVDVTKDGAQDLGIRFGHPKSTQQASPKASEHPLISKINPLMDRLNIDLAALPLAGTPASLGIALAKLGDGVLLDLELSALESESKARVISSPRLLTTNQESAIIQSGEEIPYQETTTSGATAISFKKAVLSLKVTPRITPDHKILMALQINQDRPSAEQFNGVPAILTKEIQTRVLVNNGQTLVLGGIYQQNKNDTIVRVPFWGSLPFLGVFFRNQALLTKNEELLIFITPRIITNSSSMAALHGSGKKVV